MSSLEDFFAKKDKRKKGKSKQNFVTSELLAKTIEEQSAAPTPPLETENKIDLPVATTQEDEWKEEEEVVKDFEGLRVQKLDKEEGVAEKVQVLTEYVENMVEGESGAAREMSSSASPWQPKSTPQQSDVPLEEPVEPEPETLSEKLPNVQKDVYMPPGARGGGGREGGTYVPPHMKRGGGGGAYVPPGMRRGGMGGWRGNRVPPDLKSNVAFPSLHGVAKKEEGSVTDKGEEFKEAQGPKTSRSSDAHYRVPGLELTNKFSGLEDD